MVIKQAKILIFYKNKVEIKGMHGLYVYEVLKTLLAFDPILIIYPEEIIGKTSFSQENYGRNNKINT